MSSSFAPLDDDAPHWKYIYMSCIVYISIGRGGEEKLLAFIFNALLICYTRFGNGEQPTTTIIGTTPSPMIMVKRLCMCMSLCVRVSGGGDALTRACILCRILLLLL